MASKHAHQRQLDGQGYEINRAAAERRTILSSSPEDATRPASAGVARMERSVIRGGGGAIRGRTFPGFRCAPSGLRTPICSAPSSVRPRASGDPGTRKDSRLQFGSPLARGRNGGQKFQNNRSPDGAKRNPGSALFAGDPVPDFASLHPGYELRFAPLHPLNGEGDLKENMEIILHKVGIFPYAHSALLVEGRQPVTPVGGAGSAPAGPASSAGHSGGLGSLSGPQ